MRNVDVTQSGQATTEMVFMLLGFVILLLGLLFTMSLEIYNTRVLLASKYETERLADSVNPDQRSSSNRELRGWEYRNGIPFTMSDTPVYSAAGEVNEAWEALSMASDSNADNYVYDWVTLRDFTNGKFTADYKERDPNAIAAANLVTKRGEPSGRILTARLPELHKALGKVLKLRINYDNLENNPSNRVYLPANGEL